MQNAYKFRPVQLPEVYNDATMPDCTPANTPHLLRIKCIAANQRSIICVPKSIRFNLVVLFVGPPARRTSVTKIQKRGIDCSKCTKKVKIKKRASSLEPLASCKKSLKAFLFYLHLIVTRKSIFLFTSKKTNFKYLLTTLMFNFYLFLITYFQSKNQNYELIQSFYLLTNYLYWKLIFYC